MNNRLVWAKLLTAAIIVLLLSVQGWSHSRDIEKYSYVLLGGDDAGPDGEFYLLLSIAIPEAMGSGGSSQESSDSQGGGQARSEAELIHKTRCQAIWQGIHTIQSKVEDPLHFGHVQARIFGEELARRGISESLDATLRMAEARRNSWALVADGTAEEILDAVPKTKKLPALYISELMETASFIKVMPPIILSELAGRIFNPGEEGIAPIVKAEKETLTISGLALFKDDKMVGKLNHDEMHYFFLVAAGQGQKFKRVEIPSGESFMFEVANVKRKIKPHVNDGQISFVIKLEVEGNVLESSTQRSLQDEKLQKELESAIATALQKDCRAVLRRLQKEFEVDSYSLGRIVRARYPKLWRELDWQEEFPSIPINIQVQAKIRRLGMGAR